MPTVCVRVTWTQNAKTSTAKRRRTRSVRRLDVAYIHRLRGAPAAMSGTIHNIAFMRDSQAVEISTGQRIRACCAQRLRKPQQFPSLHDLDK